MGKVHITIYGRRYAIGCDDGQEAHLEKLARYFDQQVSRLGDNVGQIGEQRLFLMAGLMIADELYEAQQKLNAAEAEANRLRDDHRMQSTALDTGDAEAARRAAATLSAAAQRVEDLAALIERS
jgi:cell division protein ZapA